MVWVGDELATREKITNNDSGMHGNGKMGGGKKSEFYRIGVIFWIKDIYGTSDTKSMKTKKKALQII